MQRPRPRPSPSPSAVPLPVSPNASQNDFEALIDLLASDEPVGQDADASVTSKKIEVNHPALDLRDEGGRLDFAKIKTLFLSHGPNPQNLAASSSKYDKVVVDEAKHTRAAATQVIGSTLPTGGISSLLHLQWPTKIVEPFFESGLSPVLAESTPVTITRPLQYENLDLIDLSDEPALASDFNESDVLSSTNSALFHESPPPLDEPPASLLASLALARQEVVMLRKRVQVLENLISKSLGQLPPQQAEEHKREPGRDAFMFSSENGSQEVQMEVGMQHDPDELMTHGSTPMTDRVGNKHDLSALSLAQTRSALKSLLDELALPPSCVTSLFTGRRNVSAMPTSFLDEIHRAVDLVTFLDELVWRRSRMGAVYDNVYGQENIQALQDRLELWERTVRTRR